MLSITICVCDEDSYDFNNAAANHTAAGMYYAAHGNLDKACLAFRSASKFHTDSSESKSNLGSCLINLKDFDSAETILIEAWTMAVNTSMHPDVELAEKNLDLLERHRRYYGHKGKEREREKKKNNEVEKYRRRVVSGFSTPSETMYEKGFPSAYLLPPDNTNWVEPNEKKAGLSLSEFDWLDGDLQLPVEKEEEEEEEEEKNAYTGLDDRDGDNREEIMRDDSMDVLDAFLKSPSAS